MTKEEQSCEGCEALWHCATVPCGCMLRFDNFLLNGEYKHKCNCPKPLNDKDYKTLYWNMNEWCPQHGYPLPCAKCGYKGERK
jgi:hypothetical protein